MQQKTKKEKIKNKQETKRDGPEYFSEGQLYALKRRFEVQEYVTAQECKQLAYMVGLPRQVKVWFENRRYKNKRQQMEHARLSPKGAKDSKDGFLTNSPISTDLKTPSPSFPLALSSLQALPTPTEPTPLYTLPGSDYFRYPPLLNPGLPTLPNSIYYPHSAGPCRPSLT